MKKAGFPQKSRSLARVGAASSCAVSKKEKSVLSPRNWRLEMNLSGAAQFRPLEPNLLLVISGDGKGHINVKGEAQATLGSGTHLEFQFEIDQTYLKDLAKALLAADPI
jgi:hypothetical protein